MEILLQSGGNQKDDAPRRIDVAPRFEMINENAKN